MDSSGLYYGARYYEPEVGRFITEDIIIGSIEFPQSLNRYVYCLNNPLKFIDPDGRWVWILIPIGAIVGGTLKATFYMFQGGEWSGVPTQILIGVGAGAVATGTMGMGALAEVGTLGTILIGGVSGITSGATEKVLETAAYNLNLPGIETMPSVNAMDIPIDFLSGAGGSMVTESLDFSLEYAYYRMGDTSDIGMMLGDVYTSVLAETGKITYTYLSWKTSQEMIDKLVEFYIHSKFYDICDMDELD